MSELLIDRVIGGLEGIIHCWHETYVTECEFCNNELRLGQKEVEFGNYICPVCNNKNEVPEYIINECKIKRYKEYQKEIKKIHLKYQKEEQQKCRNEWLQKQQESQKQQELKQQESIPSNRIPLCLISFLIPIAGLFAGILLLTKSDELDQKTGGYCLIWSFIGFIIGLFIMFSIYH